MPEFLWTQNPTGVTIRWKPDFGMSAFWEIAQQIGMPNKVSIGGKYYLLTELPFSLVE